MSLAFTVAIKPRSLNAKLKKDYADTISVAARRCHTGIFLAGPLYSRIIWFHKDVSNQGDIDNVAKRIHDALKGVAYADDQAITHTVAIRVDASRTVRVLGDPANPDAEFELAVQLQNPQARDVLYIEIGEQLVSEVHLGPVQ